MLNDQKKNKTKLRKIQNLKSFINIGRDPLQEYT